MFISSNVPFLHSGRIYQLDLTERSYRRVNPTVITRNAQRRCGENTHITTDRSDSDEEEHAR